jgi:organic radical activating enzyme
MQHQIKFVMPEFKNKPALRSIDKFKLENTGSVPVMEIFKTYEGEGLKIGTPRVLVRLGGCPVHCVNCDTPQSFTVKKSMKVMTPSEVIEAVLNLINDETNRVTVREVSITGGEPMMYPELCTDRVEHNR